MKSPFFNNIASLKRRPGAGSRVNRPAISSLLADLRNLRHLRIILFLSLLTASCDRCDKPSKVVFALFDLSASTQTQEVRQFYFDNFKKVADDINPGDVIVADKITENPLAQSSFPVNEKFDKYDPVTQNKLAYEEELKRKKEETLDRVKDILFNQSQKVNMTPIMDALQLAERVFKTEKRDQAVLVLFSDMVEESDHCNLRRDNLNDKRIDQLIAGEKSKGRLPDLKGVRVYVVGAAAGTYEKMKSEKIFGLENFWLKYFKECGADLAKERYGGPLLEFKE